MLYCESRALHFLLGARPPGLISLEARAGGRRRVSVADFFALPLISRKPKACNTLPRRRFGSGAAFVHQTRY